MEMTDQETNALKDRIRKVIETPKEYRSTEIRYLTIFMKEQPQDDLVRCIADLTLEELNIAFGAGIPGDAYAYALGLATVAKRRIRAEQQKRMIPREPAGPGDEAAEDQ